MFPMKKILNLTTREILPAPQGRLLRIQNRLMQMVRVENAGKG